MSQHISDDRALILAALAAVDPERRAAQEHAARCPKCARVLSEGEAMLALVDAQAAELQIDPRLKARILSAVAESPQDRRAPRWEHVGLTLGAVLSACLAWLDGRGPPGLYPAHGHYCVLWELLGATLPLIGAGLWATRTSKRPEPLRLALIALGGAIAGQLFLRWRCPTSDSGLHLLVFHAAGVLLAALLGLMAGQLARPSA
jgi:hypothetical protein